MYTHSWWLYAYLGALAERRGQAVTLLDRAVLPGPHDVVEAIGVPPTHLTVARPRAEVGRVVRPLQHSP